MADLTGQIAAAMAALIAVREDLMVDECTATRPDPQTGDGPLDPDTGMPTEAAAAPPVYSGPCVVADPGSGSLQNRSTTDEGGVPNQRVLRTPHRAALLPGDLVTVTVCAFSPGLVDSVFVVIGEEERTYATFRKYVLRGSSWEATS